MVGWHHWLNGHESEQPPGVGDGQESLVCCSPWGHKELDMAEWLDWTELWCIEVGILWSRKHLDSPSLYWTNTQGFLSGSTFTCTLPLDSELIALLWQTFWILQSQPDEKGLDSPILYSLPILSGFLSGRHRTNDEKPPELNRTESFRNGM